MTMNWVEQILLAIDALLVVLALRLFLFRKQKGIVTRPVAKRVAWALIVLAINAGFLWNDPNPTWALRLVYVPFCLFAISFPILDLRRSRKRLPTKGDRKDVFH